MSSSGPPTVPALIRYTLLFSAYPPRSVLVLIRCPACRLALFMVRSRAYTFFTPPVISLPMVMPPCPLAKLLFWMTTFWLGTLTRRPSASRPDLIAMQSSPVLKVTLSMTTPSQDSGSQPSVFGPEDEIDRPRTVTFRHRFGFRCQNGEFSI